MYVVIFRATIDQLDEDYVQTAQYLRQLAINEYHCIDFQACGQGNDEIAVSYWHSLGDIQAWRHNVDHQIAQNKGVWKWYKSCRVEIAEIVRQYERSQ
ncbi:MULTISPECIES: antibiotic biosynthesis monooxygenase family protein [Vitreoscilla]|uniref:Antibiotic biosynthesis monooxygenase n=1 Tax=Vitreoscilla stercoraria TaxID=61 RepID=A0ABY4EAP4_VITST|nr:MULTISPECIES: hypothetical protein [Vitreoscilla]AUZ05802.1 hypothetical protein ADP71_24670 [Vitreoscilla sp. C1]UOO92821.1 antibiotic biosynthesis monooxygenase [Vitreoscilla stercoraria]